MPEELPAFPVKKIFRICCTHSVRTLKHANDLFIKLIQVVYGSGVYRHRGVCRCICQSSTGPFNKANIFLSLTEYELNNSLLGASRLVDYI